jgi:two-component system chemotaxis response regulator CheY
MAYNVLIVDDSKAMRNVIKKILSISGFRLGEFLEASNGQEALEVLENHWVDLVLTDIHMPVMNGLDLLRALTKDELWQDIPVAFITTDPNEDSLRQALELGAKGYIRKPFHPETIRAFLYELLGETDEYGMAASDEGCDF